jgi:hypothetical protein
MPLHCAALLFLGLLTHSAAEVPNAPVPDGIDFGNDELCAATPQKRPWIAVMLCGNFRTFSDPRVHKTIRSKLTDALGANVVTFIYGKVDGEHKPNGLRGDVVRSSAAALAREVQLVSAAIDYLKAGSRRVVYRVENHTRREDLHPKCPIYDNQNKETIWKTNSYVGQLQSNHVAFKMVEAYETEHGVRFEWVAKARPDAMWLRSVAPWCTYRPGTAYVIAPAPADWFMLLPRAVAQDAFLHPYESSAQCAKDNSAHAVLKFTANCCGGGPTAAILGEIMRSRVPLVGPEYVGSKWGPSPAGSFVTSHMMWHTLVMRTAAKQEGDDWCHGLFLYGQEQPQFPDSETCRHMLAARIRDP